MLLLSPAKSLRETPTLSIRKYTQPRLKSETAELVDVMRKMSVPELMKLMKLSDALARLNAARYRQFKPEKYSTQNARPAAATFNGAVYQGLKVEAFSPSDWAFAQTHLRILSGLYGLLRPLDLIQEYRLEMGTKLSFNGYKNLYEYWRDKITALINKDLKASRAKTVINLASREYFKAVNTKQLAAPVLTIDFREERNGEYKFITFNAKKARGLMARYIIQNQLTDVNDLKGFLDEGYAFNEKLSNEDTWYFTR